MLTIVLVAWFTSSACYSVIFIDVIENFNNDRDYIVVHVFSTKVVKTTLYRHIGDPPKYLAMTHIHKNLTKGTISIPFIYNGTEHLFCINKGQVTLPSNFDPDPEEGYIIRYSKYDHNKREIVSLRQEDDRKDKTSPSTDEKLIGDLKDKSVTMRKSPNDLPLSFYRIEKDNKMTRIEISNMDSAEKGFIGELAMDYIMAARGYEKLDGTKNGSDQGLDGVYRRGDEKLFFTESKFEKEKSAEAIMKNDMCSHRIEAKFEKVGKETKGVIRKIAKDMAGKKIGITVMTCSIKPNGKIQLALKEVDPREVGIVSMTMTYGFISGSKTYYCDKGLEVCLDEFRKLITTTDHSSFLALNKLESATEDEDAKIPAAHGTGESPDVDAHDKLLQDMQEKIDRAEVIFKSAEKLGNKCTARSVIIDDIVPKVREFVKKVGESVSGPVIISKDIASSDLIDKVEGVLSALEEAVKYSKGHAAGAPIYGCIERIEEGMKAI